MEESFENPHDEFSGPMFDSAMSNLQMYQSMQKMVVTSRAP